MHVILWWGGPMGKSPATTAGRNPRGNTVYIYISILIKLLSIYNIKQEKYIIYLLAGEAKTHLNKHQNPLYTNLANLECAEDHRDA